MNSFGSKISITGSEFNNMNTCGAVIRNKKYLYTKTWTGSSYAVAY